MEFGLMIDHTYGVNQAKRSLATFEKASVTAGKWYCFWNTLSYIIDIGLGLLALGLTINSQVPFLSNTVVTTFATIITVLKTAEGFCNFKGRATSAYIISENYNVVAGKITDAMNTLVSIEENGVTEKEMLTWHRLTNLVEALIKQASHYPSATVTEVENVASALSDLQKIESTIFERQQQQVAVK